jgi:LysM repeat protein
MTKRAVSVVFALLTVLSAPTASAFPHVVRPGETLAQIAGRLYGDAKRESLLAGANALDVGGGSAIVPGMRLEIPAPSHHKVVAGETWASLALAWLGGAPRADVLARANHAVPWVSPEAGLQIEVPPVVAHIVSEGDTSTTLAARYWGDGNRGWELNAFNGRAEVTMHRGEIILVPLTELVLTEAGLAEARASLVLACSEVDVGGLLTQRRADSELPAVVADVREGRYVETVARANRVLGSGQLTRPQLALLYRALLEAYIALDAPLEAKEACVSLRANARDLKLDPTTTSPKIRAACGK